MGSTPSCSRKSGAHDAGYQMEGDRRPLASSSRHDGRITEADGCPEHQPERQRPPFPEPGKRDGEAAQPEIAESDDGVERWVSRAGANAEEAGGGFWESQEPHTDEAENNADRRTGETYAAVFVVLGIIGHGRRALGVRGPSRAVSAVQRSRRR
jgi:hypothetical protein